MCESSYLQLRAKLNFEGYRSIKWEAFCEGASGHLGRTEKNGGPGPGAKLCSGGLCSYPPPPLSFFSDHDLAILYLYL